MKIIKDTINISELKQMLERGFFVDVIKAVIDLEKEIMAVDAEMHADLMNELIEQEHSNHQNLWGVNLYPGMPVDEFIVFTSLINIKPSLGYKSVDIHDQALQEKIRNVINKLIQR